MPSHQVDKLLNRLNRREPIVLLVEENSFLKKKSLLGLLCAYSDCAWYAPLAASNNELQSALQSISESTFQSVFFKEHISSEFIANSTQCRKKEASAVSKIFFIADRTR